MYNKITLIPKVDELNEVIIHFSEEHYYTGFIATRDHFVDTVCEQDGEITSILANPSELSVIVKCTKEAIPYIYGVLIQLQSLFASYEEDDEIANELVRLGTELEQLKKEIGDSEPTLDQLRKYREIRNRALKIHQTLQ